jgi:hypothetical protein
MENLRKKNETEMQNKMEDQSSRLVQAEDRISELEDEMINKGKTKELLVKQHKNCQKIVQEFTDSIKRPNLECIIYSTKYNRKFPKYRETYTHTGTESLQNTKQT